MFCTFSFPQFSFRGLSKFYGGKSKSFRDLTEVQDVEDLRKREHIMNRKRALKLRLRRLNVKQKFQKSTVLINQEEEIEDEANYLKRSFSLDDLLSWVSQ